jgi:hypothetical protein
MKKKKPTKDFNTMTTDEIMGHVFHPKVAEALRKHVGKEPETKEPRPKKTDK